MFHIVHEWKKVKLCIFHCFGGWVSPVIIIYVEKPSLSLNNLIAFIVDYQTETIK